MRNKQPFRALLCEGFSQNIESVVQASSAIIRPGITSAVGSVFGLLLISRPIALVKCREKYEANLNCIVIFGNGNIR